MHADICRVQLPGTVLHEYHIWDCDVGVGFAYLDEGKQDTSAHSRQVTHKKLENRSQGTRCL